MREKMRKNFKESLTGADLNGVHGELLELGQRIGCDALFCVLSVLGGPAGMQVYIPTPANFISSVHRNRRDEMIRSRYRGTSASILEIAENFDLSTIRIRQILANQKNKEFGS